MIIENKVKVDAFVKRARNLKKYRNKTSGSICY